MQNRNKNNPIKRRAKMRNFLILLMVVGVGRLVQAQTYSFKAPNYNGKTQYFVDRGTIDGKATYGIKGEGVTGEVHSADMWFNSFPGNSGTYNIQFGVVLEDDGDPEYAVTAGSRLIKKGRFPYASGSRKCSGSYKKASYLNLGDHQVNKGEKINIWGKSVYYCGRAGDWHGAYTRWFEIKFTLKGGTSGDPTMIISPGAGVELVEGKPYTFIGEGENLVWSYDASSDGKGEIQMGTGPSVSYTIPTGVTGARTITVFLNGAGGSDQKVYKIAAFTGIQQPDGFSRGSTGQVSLRNEPNPFSGYTTIIYTVSPGQLHKVGIYNSNGNLVRKVVVSKQGIRQNRVVWDGKDAAGRLVKEGVYYYVLETAGQQPVTNRMIITR
jgi:hypothetical protein